MITFRLPYETAVLVQVDIMLLSIALSGVVCLVILLARLIKRRYLTYVNDPLDLFFAAMSGLSIGYLSGNTGGLSGAVAAAIPILFSLVLFGLVGGPATLRFLTPTDRKISPTLSKNIERRLRPVGFVVLIGVMMGVNVGAKVRTINTLQVKREDSLMQICVALYSNHWPTLDSTGRAAINDKFGEMCEISLEYKIGN